jgi:hypothetical protein
MVISVIDFVEPTVGPIHLAGSVGFKVEDEKGFVALIKCFDQNGESLEGDEVMASYSTSLSSNFLYLPKTPAYHTFPLGSFAVSRPIARAELSLRQWASRGYTGELEFEFLAISVDQPMQSGTSSTVFFAKVEQVA